jgi:hypothetical protein
MTREPKGAVSASRSPSWLLKDCAQRSALDDLSASLVEDSVDLCGVFLQDLDADSWDGQ